MLRTERIIKVLRRSWVARVVEIGMKTEAHFLTFAMPATFS